MSTFADLADACAAERPAVAVVLGSGLGPVARNLVRRVSLSFGDVPGLPAPTVLGHGGRLTLGDWSGRRVLLFEGRVHRYEGHAWDVVVRPVAVAAELGARILVQTNAAGGIRDDLVPGSLMPIRDHLEWTRLNGWRHAGPGGLGPSRASPYTPRLLELLTSLAVELGITPPPGIYAQLTGPCYETPAEIRALRRCGADAVGMSTAREAQTASVLGMECAAISCITNRAAGLSGAPLDHREVLATAAAQAERLGSLLERFLANLPL